ncbi:MAG: 50S ribosomal protein L13 [Cytophagales bacterium]|nr:50S ribosomal protein L13 [Cytophagales bacterium]
MDVLSNRTEVFNANEVDRLWWVVDARDRILGRLASQLATILMGKHKPKYASNLLCGDHVVVVNAERVRLTGKKFREKRYIRHTGYPGGQREDTPYTLYKRVPHRILEQAVRRMLPKTRMGRKQYTLLHVYVGDKHPHEAQNPQTLPVHDDRS